MRDFYQFVESLTSEIDFIRTFFTNSKSYTNFDKHTLLVFADFLQENDDPRSELIRTAAGDDLRVNFKNRDLARKLKINRIRAFSFAGMDLMRVFYHAATFYLDIDHFDWYEAQENKDRILVLEKIEFNKIPDEPVTTIFWSIIGYGF